jgi:hypothetical protein
LINKSLPADDYYEYLAMNTTENSQILEKFLQATANFPSREELQQVIQDNANNTESLEKIINMLSGISPASIRELQTILQEVMALARQPSSKATFGQILEPTEFNLLSHNDKKQYFSKFLIPNFQISHFSTDKIEENENEEFDDDENEESITGRGIGKAYNLARKPKRIILGKGLAIAEAEPKYKEFGKYAIHWGQLTNNDILNVKYKSLGRVPNIKPQAVSDIFRDFIIDVLETGKVNQRLYNQVPDEEKKLFEKVAIGAGLLNTLKLKKVTIDKEMEDINRFNLLKGEYLAGNNNTQVLKELRKYIVKFINENRIPKTEGYNLLMELSV